MNVCVVGWYGTDTLGDRAIFDGILAVINKLEFKNKVYLGSLFPFYSKRMLFEEKSVFKTSAPNTDIEIFDIKNKSEREKTIKQSDMLILGGGPIMDIDEVGLIEKCFAFAKKNKKIAIIMGCGIGPLSDPIHIKEAKSLMEISDGIFLRNQKSVELANKILDSKGNILCMGDPAIISIENYCTDKAKQNYVAINFRDYPRMAYGENAPEMDDFFKRLIKECSNCFERVKLVPMHTFCIGGDDRKYLCRLVMDSINSSIEVMHKPMNINDLYDVYAEAQACVGMRYHSVVLQTILNGNNIVLNYTDGKDGKIPGFIKMLDTSFYDGRTFNLQERVDWNCQEIVGKLKEGSSYQYKKTNMLYSYVEAIKKIMK